MFRSGLRLILEQSFTGVQVHEAGSVSEGLELAERNCPIDLALVDLQFPGEDGIDAIVALRQISPDTRVAALTASDEPGDMVRVREAGAMGYVRKTLGPGALRNVIELMMSGERFFPIPESGGREVGENHSGSRAAVPTVRVTPRQRQILQGLVDGLSNKEIARNLDIIEGTVKAHVRSLMGKLGVRNRTQLAVTATRAGLLDDSV
jgi:two-component system nitrate/nitrite response regulator NarL